MKLEWIRITVSHSVQKPHLSHCGTHTISMMLEEAQSQSDFPPDQILSTSSTSRVRVIFNAIVKMNFLASILDSKLCLDQWSMVLVSSNIDWNCLIARALSKLSS